ncbi:tRNA (N(6)-L-threonylcarbamoyladenosine(37)-C(2))-methylthiotransferase MtaB [Helicobacter cetorum]|uniref:tRNA (N(6)-L-threonylcarbamoyladenosine(37)-C(2))- methylthiotransferase MtaB n=1 Tax=Helicobacter cetorum TaxID=138563 RepID=UPI000CF0F289|nr:tRNA (N(6)-L-threonylcarbamoyladenosine(37)-C(2))-methylthiotransferase MtaB [Helicobacter cetorum]
MKKVYFKTFGCRTNLFDTQVMLENLKDFSVTLEESLADVIVINSCTVTNGADSSVRSYAKKMARLNKEVLFTGCGVKTQGKELFEKGVLKGVFGHDNKEKINTLLQEKKRFFIDDDLENKHLDSTMVSEFVGKTRAFIKIQEGCDFDCNYCIIPSVRGRARSFEERKILEQVSLLCAKGVQEVVLTGTNVGSYGKDRESNIARLIKKLSQLNGLKRIRVGSLEPNQITDEFLELLEEDFLEKHLHIALQHSHDIMLERMNRRNRAKSDRELLEKIASKNFAIGTDFIVGHPGETQKVWEIAFKNLESLPLTHIHPFIYSKRKSTPSSLMTDSVNLEDSKKRLNMVKDLINHKNKVFRELQLKLNTPLKILVESQKDSTFKALDQFFNPIKIKSNKPLKASFLEIREYQIGERENHANF